jgi:nucleoside-diphosphate-sugar epimerase
MHVALTGVSGFIGSVIARHLHEAGHTVTGLLRSTSRRDHLEAWVERLVVGDHADPSCWPELLAGADCVIHNSFDFDTLRQGDLERHLRENLLASIDLMRTAAPRQFVFMSTIAVHHDMRPRWQGLIDEDHPLRPGSWYGACKAAVEAHLWAAWYGQQQHTCAIRPCAVYGLDPRPERSIGHPLVQQVRQERRYARSGGGKFVHVDDVAQVTVATVGNADAAGKAYNLVDCYARWADLALMVAELLGVEAQIDLSSPPAPRNHFDCSAARGLGVPLNRGHDGLRQHLAQLIDLSQATERPSD